MPDDPAALIRTRLSDAVTRIEASGSDTARLDAELLAAHVLRRDRTWVLAHDNEHLTPAQVAEFEALVQRRVRHEPVAYILGRQGFRMIELEVDNRVLIPRPETEFVVEAVLEEVTRRELDGRGPTRIVDVGTGSGAIAIATALEAPDGAVEVTATDLSPDALAVARSNALRLSASVRLVEGSLLEPVADETFDVIASNPPYIPSSAASSLMSDVVDYEPHLALFADGDGTSLARELAEQALASLRPGGLLIFEVGAGQADNVQAMLRAVGFVDTTSTGDLAGIDRVVTARRPF